MRSSPPDRPSGHALAAGVVPAAGRGVRLGGDLPKALRIIGNRPMLWWAVRNLLASGELAHVVVVAPPEQPEIVRTALAGLSPVTVVPGGSTRQESVRRGLAAVPDGIDLILVHDAARPFVPADVVTRVCEALRNGAEAVIPVLPVADTIKRIDGNAVRETLDRESLRAVQTPQGFRRDVLDRAHALTSGSGVTDDAGMVERLDVLVRAVAGAPEAFKVTTPFDLLTAELFLARAGEKR